MRQHVNRLISLALIIVLVLGMGINALGEELNESSTYSVPSGTDGSAGANALSELNGHWAKSTIEEWIRLGLLKGDSNGKYYPDRAVTRAEFMAMVNRVMNYTQPGESIENYTDISPDKWYYNDCAIALEAGYIKGTSETELSPEAPITREQAITIVARIKGIDQSADMSALSLATDSAAVSSWAKSAVAAAINEGFVTGSNGMINPAGMITRSEAIVLLDRIRTDTRVYYFANEYGPETGTDTVNNVIIAGPGVSLKNTIVNGNLQIAGSVGDGDAYLNNVTVHGHLIVNGGGKNSLYFANITVEGGIVVRRDDAGAVRIVVSGKSNVNAVVLQSGAILVAQDLADGNIKEVIIPADYLGGSPVEFIGNFSSITSSFPGLEILLTRATVENMNLNAGATITGTEGSVVKNANISKEAGKQTTMNISPVNISGEGAADASISGKSATPTPVPSKPSSSAGSGSSSSRDDDSSSDDSSSSETYPYIVSVPTVTETVYHNQPYTLPQKVAVNLSNGNTALLAVTWEASTVSTEKCGTFSFSGTLTLVSGIRNPNNLKAQLLLTVEPTVEKITIYRQPNKVDYYLGEELDITGLAVKVHYSDNSEAEAENITLANISGYDPNSPGEQTITVTLNGKTATFKVYVYEKPSGILKAVYSDNLSPVVLPNGASSDDIMRELPQTVQVAVYQNQQEYLQSFVKISWNRESFIYDPAKKTRQEFVAKGKAVLPDTLTNPDNISLDIALGVTVDSAKFKVYFNLNGHGEKEIEPQIVEYGSKANKPKDPVSSGYEFLGWYENAEGTGDPFDFDNTVIENDVTLYAKWKAVFDLNVVKEQLTFDRIRGNNENHQSIVSDLNLISSMDEYPGITVSWKSSNPAYLTDDGKVTRPGPDQDDVIVILTATISDGSNSVTKDFELVVRKQGIENVTIGFIDPYFVSGYPMATVEDGQIVIKFRLNKKADVYITVDNVNANNWKSSVTGVLHGHATETIDSTREDTSTVYVSLADYVKVEDPQREYSVKTNIRPNSGRAVNVNFVVRDGDYLSEKVTTIRFDMETVTALDETPPSFSVAFINDAMTKIYIYCIYEKLDLKSAPDADAFSLTDKNGNPNGKVTGVALYNVPDAGHYYVESWIELTVSEIANPDDLTVWYTAQADRLKDASGNAAKDFKLTVASADMSITNVYVNAAAGIMMVEISPLINLLEKGIPTEHIAVTNNGVPVDIISAGPTYSIHDMRLYYTFTPVETENLNFEVVYNPETGTKDLAFDDVSGPIAFKGEIQYIPVIDTSNVKAVYDSEEHEIILTFDEDVQISKLSCNCAYVLNVNGTEYRLRGWNNSIQNNNQIRITVGNHVPELSGNVTITYDPLHNDDGIEDMAGAKIGKFGPIPVEIK